MWSKAVGEINIFLEDRRMGADYWQEGTRLQENTIIV